MDNDCDGIVDNGSNCACTSDTYGGHTYLFCDDAKNWYNARSACQSYGNFDLAVITDSSENSWIQSSVQSVASNYWWWFGYENMGAPNWQEPYGGWSWVNGSNSWYTNWNGGQPDDYNGNEDCAHMYGDTGRWNDLNCSLDNWYGSYVYFICEEL